MATNKSKTSPKDCPGCGGKGYVEIAAINAKIPCTCKSEWESEDKPKEE